MAAFSQFVARLNDDLRQCFASRPAGRCWPLPTVPADWRKTGTLQGVPKREGAVLWMTS